jgi:hypothetical protein
MALSKKEFKELAQVHVYGKGERRRVALFYDWMKNFDLNAVGFKYMVKGYGCTKAQILKDAYNILIENDCSELCWYDMKVAETDQQRFKPSISG